MTYSNKQFFGGPVGATGATGPTGYTGAIGPAGWPGWPKPMWHRVSKLHPRRWFGYAWYRRRLAPDMVGGGNDGYEYRTDKQMADAMLAQLAPKQRLLHHV